jgi:hypothetical protein
LENPKVRYMRSVFQTAGPIQNGTVRFDNITDRAKEQNDQLKAFLLDRIDKFTEKYSDMDFDAQMISNTILMD